MSRELLIMRHAKSDWTGGATSDFDRPLNARGRKTAPQMGRWLREQRLIPDHIVSSPALRAQQTVQQVCAELGFAAQAIRWERRIYEAGIGELLAVLSDCPAQARRVLLVGHNPGLEILVLYLCAQLALPADGKLMATATVAHLSLPDDWQGLADGCAQLCSVTRPRELPAQD